MRKNDWLNCRRATAAIFATRSPCADYCLSRRPTNRVRRPSRCLQTLGKLSVADLQNRLRRHDLLSREEAMTFARELCEIVTEEIKTLDGFEDVLERIAERIEHTRKRQPLQLEDHRDERDERDEGEKR